MRFETGRIALLKEAFRTSAFIFYRFAYYPEAMKLMISNELSSLGIALRELSSTEKYFGIWTGDDMLRRIETKYNECEELVSLIKRNLS